MCRNALNARPFALWSSALFAGGLLGYFILLSLSQFKAAAGCLVAAELLALAFGILGWSEKASRVPVIGASVVILWACAASWLFFGPAGMTARQRMAAQQHQWVLEKAIEPGTSCQEQTPLYK